MGIAGLAVVMEKLDSEDLPTGSFLNPIVAGHGAFLWDLALLLVASLRDITDPEVRVGVLVVLVHGLNKGRIEKLIPFLVESLLHAHNRLGLIFWEVEGEGLEVVGWEF